MTDSFALYVCAKHSFAILRTPDINRSIIVQLDTMTSVSLNLNYYNDNYTNQTKLLAFESQNNFILYLHAQAKLSKNCWSFFGFAYL